MKEKTKRMTKKDQEQALISWIEDFEQKALATYEGFHNIFTQSFMSNNINQQRCYCTACGHEWDMPASASYHSSGKVYCPHCHQASQGNLSPVLTHIEEHDNGWYLVRYQFEQMTSDRNNDDIFAWLKESPSYKIMTYASLPENCTSNSVLLRN